MPIKIAIVGAGVSGLMTFLKIKKDFGDACDVTIYDKSNDVGGTWRDNTYPGCACDVPSHFYSYSQELNPEWSQAFSSSSEIQAYWKGIAAKHDLPSSTRFDSRFVSADWSEEKQGYTVVFESEAGKQTTIECQVLISAIGALHVPVIRSEELGDAKTAFQGVTFHSARWDHSVSLKGKRIAIVGSGCSASQIIPVISEDPSVEVLNVMRSPNWYLPREQRAYTAFEKFMFRNVPGAMRLHRYRIAFNLELNSLIFPLKFSKFRHYIEEDALAYMRATAPEEYHSMLTPHYPLGCKRIIIDPGYCAALNRPNVTLTNSAITSIDATGINFADGTHREVDVIVMATGFDTSSGGYALNVKGRHDKTLEEQWSSQGGPQAYFGTVVANFPNFFTLLGPNVATGHSSVIFSSEAQINLIAGLLDAIVNKGVTSIAVKYDSELVFNKELTTRLEQTTWRGGCSSWYSVSNASGVKKLVSTWPGTLTELYWRTMSPVWENYRLEFGKGASRSLAKEAKAKRQRVVRLASFVALVFAARSYGFDNIQKMVLPFVLAQVAKVKQLRT